MAFGLRLFLLQALVLVCVHATFGQATAEQSAESLRAQLRELEAKQSQLQERARQLDEEMKPENIERSLALTGSTRPEELREARRQQLEKERQGVRLQLDEMAASRTRLEAAIATAEAVTYRQSALPPAPTPATPQSNTVTAPSTGQVQPKRRRQARRPRPRRRRA